MPSIYNATALRYLAGKKTGTCAPKDIFYGTMENYTALFTPKRSKP
ncbi:MAG: hypothetical protein AAGD05_03975 [Bacteroidota bacterium]